MVQNEFSKGQNVLPHGENELKFGSLNFSRISVPYLQQEQDTAYPISWCCTTLARAQEELPLQSCIRFKIFLTSSCFAQLVKM